MHANDLFKLAHKRPFEPFRFYMDDGTMHTVSHPELIWVTSTAVLIGAVSGEILAPDWQLMLDNAHISRVEYISPKKAPESNGKH